MDESLTDSCKGHPSQRNSVEAKDRLRPASFWCNELDLSKDYRAIFRPLSLIG